MAIQAELYSENHGFPLPSYGSRDLMDNNGNCGFNESYFNLQQKQQQQLQHMQHISALKNNTNNNNCFRLQSMADTHRQELDRFISLQNESLRLILQEQRKQELASFLQKIEAKTHALLKQKDAEIAKAANRTMELENFMRKLEMENQAWQRVANENEAMVISLNNKIEQLKESNAYNGFFNNVAEDAESCCDLMIDIEDAAAQTGENRVGFVEERRNKMLCKSCNSRDSCVLFLPCRHLCSCQACEAFLDSCPVCKMVKKASIEPIIF